MNDLNCPSCGRFTSDPGPCCDRPDTCTVDGCQDDAKARGWCSKHYQRWSHHGHTGLMDEPTARRDAARHGTRYRYQTGCRCFPCALANSRYLRDLQDGDGRRTPLGDVLPHVEALLKSGWTARDIEREAGLANSTVWRLRHTDQESVNSRTAESLLSLPLADDVRLDPAPLLDALQDYADARGGLAAVLNDSDRTVFYRVAHRGWVSEGWADRIACSVLGMPLPLLYGTNYDEEAA